MRTETLAQAANQTEKFLALNYFTVPQPWATVSAAPLRTVRFFFSKDFRLTRALQIDRATVKAHATQWLHSGCTVTKGQNVDKLRFELV